MKSYLIRNLRKIMLVILDLFSAVDTDIGEIETSLNGVIEREFFAKYDLIASTTTIVESNNGSTITKTTSDGTATTTFASSNGTDTITTTVVPTTGDYNYTKTTTISTSSGTTTISTSYTRTAKQS